MTYVKHGRARPSRLPPDSDTTDSNGWSERRGSRNGNTVLTFYPLRIPEYIFAPKPGPLATYVSVQVLFFL